MSEIDDELYEKICNAVLADESLRICENCLDYTSCENAGYGHTCPDFDWEDWQLREEILKRAKNEI